MKRVWCLLIGHRAVPKGLLMIEGHAIEVAHCSRCGKGL